MLMIVIFCMTKVAGFTKKTKHLIDYPNLPSALRPVPHGPGIPVPVPPEDLKEFSDDESEVVLDSEADENWVPSTSGLQPKLLDQSALNDLTRDLGLSKEAAQILGSRFQERNLFSSETKFAWYRQREHN